MTGETAKELMQLKSWEAFIGEVDRLIAYEEKKLRTVRPEDLSPIQMKIAAYEAVKNIPQNVIDNGDEDGS